MNDQPVFGSADYWDQRYQLHDTGWDMGRIAPPLQAYFEQLPQQAKSAPILIPGCGNAYEAAWLLDNGFTNITLLDISPALTDQLKQQLPPTINIVTADFFTHEGQYDYIVEQTFFCALDPALRHKYMEKMNTLLRPGGRLIGLLFNRSFPAGPPFGGTHAEYQSLLEIYYHLKTLAPCYNSIKPRMGTELFFIALKSPLPADSDSENFPAPI